MNTRPNVMSNLIIFLMTLPFLKRHKVSDITLILKIYIFILTKRHFRQIVVNFISA